MTPQARNELTLEPIPADALISATPNFPRRSVGVSPSYQVVNKPKILKSPERKKFPQLNVEKSQTQNIESQDNMLSHPESPRYKMPAKKSYSTAALLPS